jgi:hypothetical protein
VVAPERSI